MSDSTHSEHSHIKIYLMVFALLGVLTAGSFGVANSSLMENRQVGWTIMMLVSVAKALLVILFFMHLRWETRWKYVLTIPAAIMSMVLVLTLFPDIVMRSKFYSQTRQNFGPEVAPVSSLNMQDSTAEH
jgi:cytochrome c oxidase subunit IV